MTRLLARSAREREYPSLALRANKISAVFATWLVVFFGAAELVLAVLANPFAVGAQYFAAVHHSLAHRSTPKLILIYRLHVSQPF